jgi:phosphoribosylamine--glycine ligase
MITETGPKVVEYNCRFGDPETQAVLPLREDDLADLLDQSASGNLTISAPRFVHGCAVCVVIASGGYPDSYEIDKPILGLDSVNNEPGVIVFHAGTRRDRKGILTSGGRVLGVTAVSERNDLEESIRKAYRVVHRITFDAAYYRSDIGKKGLQRLRQLPQEGTA